MQKNRHVTVLWIIIAALSTFNLWTWWHHYQVTREYQRELVDVIQDAYERGAYPPGHPLYETASLIAAMRELWKGESEDQE